LEVFLPGRLYQPFVLLARFCQKVKLKKQKLENNSGFGGFQSPEVRNKIVLKNRQK
jgi:murein tripeptide amidase MpaA